jgi:hypothetical protein
VFKRQKSANYRAIFGLAAMMSWRGDLGEVQEGLSGSGF